MSLLCLHTLTAAVMFQQMIAGVNMLFCCLIQNMIDRLTIILLALPSAYMNQISSNLDCKTFV